MEEVQFPTGDGRASATGYVTSPAQGTGLGVVLVPDEGNVTPFVSEVSERFVAEGFTPMVPALPAPSADVARAARHLTGAVAMLCDHDAVRGDGVGVVGFAGGGAVALWLATLRPEKVRAVVPFYGLPGGGLEPDWTALQASVEGHFAENDELIGTGAVEALEARLFELGKEVRMFTYPGTNHGFFDHTRVERYDADAAHLAWVRTLEMLRAKLG